MGSQSAIADQQHLNSKIIMKCVIAVLLFVIAMAAAEPWRGYGGYGGGYGGRGYGGRVRGGVGLVQFYLFFWLLKLCSVPFFLVILIFLIVSIFIKAANHKIFDIAICNFHSVRKTTLTRN